jgi:hypothetical protein
VAEEPLVRFARELEERDERLAASIAEVGELQHETASVRERAATLEEFLAGLPEKRAAAADAVRAAEGEEEERRRAHAETEAELERVEGSRDDERVAGARRAELRARDALAGARRKLERAGEEREELERAAAAAAAEAPAVEARASALAERLARVPRISHASTEAPAPGLAGAIAWSERARAALFVVRGGLDAERERVVREANELAASALGDPVAATSVAGVRRRIERS